MISGKFRKALFAVSLLPFAWGTEAQAQWTSLTGPSASLFYQGVHFTDANHGVAVGEGGFSRTVNGGTTWTSLAVAGSDLVYGIHFPTSTLGFAVGSDGGPGAIFKSIDGGATWAYKSSGSAYPLFSVRFADANSGYAVGGGGTILKTVDAGVTWTAQISGVSSVLTGVQVLSATTAIAAGESGKILKTTNGGTTWTPMGTPGFVAIKAVFFLSADIGFVAGSARLFKTMDGGATWNIKAYDAPGSSRNMHSLYFTSATTGYMAGDFGLVAKTEDVGETWTRVTTAKDYSTLKSVHFPTPITGYAVGQSGTILKTGGEAVGIRPDAGSRTSGFSLRANPANGHLSIGLSDYSGAVAEVLGLDGKVLQWTSLRDAGTLVKSGELDAGLYLVKVRSRLGVSTRTFLRR